MRFFKILSICTGFLVCTAFSEKPFRGLSYSPYRDGQSPQTGVLPTEAQIREDIRFLLQYTDVIRTYGNNGTLYSMPRICQEEGMKIHVGVWLDQNTPVNDVVIQDLARVMAEGYPVVQSAVVGNEIILRGDITVAGLVAYINQVKAVIDIPVTTGDSWWEYFNNASLAEAVDFIMYHVHPFWEDKTIEEAGMYVHYADSSLKAKYPGKTVICGETGWPSEGVPQGNAAPTAANHRKFVLDLINVAAQFDIQYFYFEAFDENWKTNTPENAKSLAGNHWGLWNADRSPKSVMNEIDPVSIRYSRPAPKSIPITSQSQHKLYSILGRDNPEILKKGTEKRPAGVYIQK